jgi:hypothetical protein
MKKVAAILFLIGACLIVGYFLLAAKEKNETKESSKTEEVTFKEEIVYTERYSARVDRVDVAFEHKDYTRYRLTTNGLVREGELNTERGYKTDEDATVYVLNWQQGEGEQIRYVRRTQDPKNLYLLDTNNDIASGTPLVLESKES